MVVRVDVRNLEAGFSFLENVSPDESVKVRRRRARPTPPPPAAAPPLCSLRRFCPASLSLPPAPAPARPPASLPHRPPRPAQACDRRTPRWPHPLTSRTFSQQKCKNPRTFLQYFAESLSSYSVDGIAVVTFNNSLTQAARTSSATRVVAAANAECAPCRELGALSLLLRPRMVHLTPVVKPRRAQESTLCTRRKG